MYKNKKLIQIHKANTDLVPANGGILAGCGFAVRYLKAMIKVDVKEEGKELRDFVDDMRKALLRIWTEQKVNSRLSGKGSMMAKSKYSCLLNPQSMFRESIPDYKGKVGQAVVDLGITNRTHNRASINKGKRVGDTIEVVKRAQALALAVREK
eukprot:1726782-Heterocapsa_arctica.AAC.1